MSEGKSGPSPTKLRAIWRREARHRDEERALIADQERRGASSAVRREILASIERHLSGEATPVGIIPAAWRATCAQMNEEERNPPAWLRTTCPQCAAPPGARCKNYAGTHCAPHRDRTKPPAQAAAQAEPKPAPPSLFDDLGDE